MAKKSSREIYLYYIRRCFLGPIAAFSLVLMVLPLMISGCASTGQQMDKSKVDQIKKGVTTRAELEQMFGVPFNSMILGDGRRQLIFTFSKTQMKGQSLIPVIGGLVGGQTNRYQMLQVILNKDNIVDDYEFSDRTTDAPNLGAQKTTETPAQK